MRRSIFRAREVTLPLVPHFAGRSLTPHSPLILLHSPDAERPYILVSGTPSPPRPPRHSPGLPRPLHLSSKGVTSTVLLRVHVPRVKS